MLQRSKHTNRQSSFPPHWVVVRCSIRSSSSLQLWSRGLFCLNHCRCSVGPRSGRRCTATRARRAPQRPTTPAIRRRRACGAARRPETGAGTTTRSRAQSPGNNGRTATGMSASGGRSRTTWCCRRRTTTRPPTTPRRSRCSETRVGDWCRVGTTTSVAGLKLPLSNFLCRFSRISNSQLCVHACRHTRTRRTWWPLLYGMNGMCCSTRRVDWC